MKINIFVEHIFLSVRLCCHIYKEILVNSKIKLFVYAFFMNLSTFSWNVIFTLFIYLGFYVAFNTVQVISQRVVRRAEETST